MNILRTVRRSLFCVLLAATSALPSTRIRDLVSLEGVRDNQLIGYGVVVGLAATGDRQQTVFSVQSLTNTLRRMGVTVPSTAVTVKNTAAVMVTGTLPPFGQPGAKIDVTVAAIGDASNLQGGLLILTPLRAANGQIFAVAQGAVVTGGFVAGRGGNSQTVNHPTVGRVIDGAIIEQTAPSVAPTDVLHLQLRQADFMTAARVVEAVNHKFAPGGGLLAQAANSGLVNVQVPPAYQGRTVEFVAALEELRVEPDRPARISINERTGTLVLGGDLKVAPVAILHGNLSVQIQTDYIVSQPNGLNDSGQTTVVPQVTVNATPEKARDVVLKQGANVEQLVHALTTIGSTPRDIIAILQNLKAAGAIDAEIEVL